MSSSNSNRPDSNKNAASIIGKHLVKFQKSQHKNMFITTIGDNLMHLRALLIGPPDSLYAGGMFYFDIFPPYNYPFHPPKVLFFITYV